MAACLASSAVLRVGAGCWTDRVKAGERFDAYLSARLEARSLRLTDPDGALAARLRQVDLEAQLEDLWQPGFDQLDVSALYDGDFDRLRSDIRQQCPELAWIEITEQGEAFEISSFGGISMARVGRDAIGASLPSALMFELAKGL